MADHGTVITLRVPAPLRDALAREAARRRLSLQRFCVLVLVSEVLADPELASNLGTDPPAKSSVDSTPVDGVE